MNRWLLKAAAQGVLARLPYRQWWNYQVQRHLTRSLRPNRADLNTRLRSARKHIRYYLAGAETDTPPAVALELGTGWFPLLPIALYLAGVGQVYTVDIQNLLRPGYFFAMLRLLASYSLTELTDQLEYVQPERHATLWAAARASQSIPAVLARLGVRPLVGAMPTLPLADESVDWIVSHTTLEHIAPADLTDIFATFRRVIAPGGLMIHMVDTGDHYAAVDPAITPYNYLQFDDRTWRWFNNALLYQNRLTQVEYIELHRCHRFTLLHIERWTHHADQFDRVTRAPGFERYTREELLPTRLWFISCPRA